jgi:uncharacterized protein (TIGR02996 family)
MTDHDPFLHAIVSQPDADAPRLIYADWLEEQGHAERAEFIRVQCELAVMKTKEVSAWDLTRLQELEDREEELLELPAALGENPIGDVARHCRHHRGFIEEATLSLGMFLFQAERALRWVPLRRLTLTHLEEQHLPILAKTPALGRLQGLTLRNDPVSQVLDLRELLASEHLQTLAAFTLVNILNRPLGHQQPYPVGPTLCKLKLSALQLDTRDLEQFLQSPLCHRLGELHLQVDMYDPGCMATLIHFMENAGLERLHMVNNSLADPGLTSHDWEALFDAPALGNLLELNLRGMYVDRDVFLRQAGSALRRLQTLRMCLNEHRIRAVVHPKRLPSLDFLDLRGADTDIIDIRTLADMPSLRKLKFLALDGRRLHRQALETFLHSRYWTGQTGLLLNHTPLTRQMMRDLRKKYRTTLPYCRVVQEMNEDEA